MRTQYALEMSVALIETRARTEMATHTRIRPPISLNAVTTDVNAIKKT